MTRVPLQLRLAGICGVLGGVIGSGVGAFLGAELFNLAMGFLLGFTAGFIIGYRIGGMIKLAEGIVRAERFAAGVDKVAIVIGWVFVTITVTALIKDGWDLPMFLATVFFLAGSLYLTYRRLRGSR